MGPRVSMVRQEMQRRASRSQPPAVLGMRAEVGQASMQRVQVPQRSGGGRVVGEDGDGYEEFGEEEPGAIFLVDETGVFSDPAEPGGTGVGPFEQGRGIDADLRIEGLAMQGGEVGG